VGSQVAIFWPAQTRRPRDRRGRATANQRWRSEGEGEGSVGGFSTILLKFIPCILHSFLHIGQRCAEEQLLYLTSYLMLNTCVVQKYAFADIFGGGHMHNCMAWCMKYDCKVVYMWSSVRLTLSLLPASRAYRAHSQLVLRLLCGFGVCLYVYYYNY